MSKLKQPQNEARKRGGITTIVSASIPVQLARALVAHCNAIGMTKSRVVGEAIERELRRTAGVKTAAEKTK